jgi:hypothetical protein
MPAKCHVWTAPSWQGTFHLAEAVGAAMCSAFLRGSLTAGQTDVRFTPESRHR